MSFSKRVQVLFLVSLCLTTFCCAHRALLEDTQVDQQNQPTTKTDGGAGGEMIKAGHVNGFGATNCGGRQPWYQPPACGGGRCGPSVPGSGCGGSGGGSPGGDCGDRGSGGSTGGCGCRGCAPPPITCPVGCMPAFGYGHWAYNWPRPTHEMDYMNNGPSPIKKEKQDDQPIKEKQDSQPMTTNEDQKMNNGSSSVNQEKQD